jgi:RNA polymerase sigma factor (TIGR02999 family)
MTTGAPDSGEITRLLVAWRGGDSEAFNTLFGRLYQELRSIARRQTRRRMGERTLCTTAVVHEAYLKLFDHRRKKVRDRGHFFAVAAMAMRQILVDDARRRTAKKRGGAGAAFTMDLDAAEASAATPSLPDLLAIDGALRGLEKLDPRLGRLVELRFFAGLSVEEAAEALDLSPRTVKRDWQKARAFLYRTLMEEE